MKNHGIKVQNQIVKLIFITLFLLPTISQNALAASIRPVCLRCECMTSPINIDTSKPRFSWKLDSDGYNIWQTAYRIQVENIDSSKTIWDSGEVKNDRQLWIEYAGQPLSSNETCRWRVKVKSGEDEQWSDWALFQTAMLNPADWKAKWIRADYSVMSKRPGFKQYERRRPESQIQATKWVLDNPCIDIWVESAALGKSHRIPKEIAKYWERDRLNEIKPAPMFRKEFAVKPGLKRAVLHGCGLGLAEWSVNGQRLGKCTFDPALTDYEKRALYQTFDLTGFLKPGGNAVGAILGEGWFGESMAYASLNDNYRYGDPGLIAQIELIYEDGTRERIVSDSSWLFTLDGPVVKNGIWCGCLYDTRREMPGWNMPGFKTNDAWAAAVEVKPLSPRLEAQNVETIDIIETTEAKEITNPKPGIWVIDLGRIVCGTIRLELKAQPKDAPVLLNYGESLDREGLVWGVGNISVSANNSDLYVCKGTVEETWIPKFTFTAFRYVQITGLKGKPNLDTVTGLFTSTDMPVTGQFECSLPLFNEMHNAFRRTVQANCRHMFTDTPTRERTGWMTWPNARSIIDNFDSCNYWDKYIADWRTSTKDSVIGSHILNWGVKLERLKFDSGRQGQKIRDVGPGMAPWHRRFDLPEQRLSNLMYPLETYIRYGDKNLIRNHYEIAKNTLDALQAIRINGLVPTMVGDWHDAVKSDLDASYRLQRGLERDDLFGGKIGGGYPVHTPGRVCGTVHVYLGAKAMAETARDLGKDEDAAKFEKLAAELKAAFNRAYFDPNTGRYSYTTPQGNTYESETMYGYALYHHLVPEDKRELTMKRFLEHIAANHGHFTSGQLGTDRVLKALTTGGQEQAAFDILTVKGFPGFDYMLSFGSQTTWETWGEMILNRTPKGSKHIILNYRPEEHCQWVAVDTWFFEYVLGIKPDPNKPGYEHFMLKPYMYRQLAWVKGSYETPRGKIVSNWNCDGKTFEWTVEVPVNSTATLFVPCETGEAEILKGKTGVIAKHPISDGRQIIEIGSGTYRLETKLYE